MHVQKNTSEYSDASVQDSRTIFFLFGYVQMTWEIFSWGDKTRTSKEDDVIVEL